MALYQVPLALLPQKGIETLFGSIPPTVQTEGIWYSLDIIVPGEECTRISAEAVWRSVQMEAAVLVGDINQLFPNPAWKLGEQCLSWKKVTAEIDNDALLDWDPETGQVTHFSIRADLRNPPSKFLGAVMSMAKEHQLLFMNANGRLALPQREEVIALVKDTRNFSFVQNPRAFLESFAKEQFPDEK